MGLLAPSSQKAPWGHASQLSWALLGWNVPATQALHSTDSLAAEKRPAPHCMGVADPSGHSCPAQHSRQKSADVAAVLELYRPAAQGRGNELPSRQ